MAQYWGMKTFVEWSNVFRQENVVGIDQEGVDANYLSMSDAQVQQLLTNQAGHTEFVDRVFREFPKWMRKDDLIIIGTPTPRPMQRFARTARLELIHETDFHEAILSLI
jgi:hypothetical protein